MPAARSLFGILLLISTFHAGALSLEESLAASSLSTDARIAEVRAKSAVILEGIASFPGDPIVTLEPGYRRIAAEVTSIPQQSALGLSLTLTIPFGLTEDDRFKALFASEEASFRREELDWTLEGLRLKAYSLYVAAWAAQAESKFIARGTQLSEEEFAIAQALWKSGKSTYTDLRNAEEDLNQARSAELYGSMNERVRRLELFSWLGIADDGSALTMNVPAVKELPRGPELAAWALERDPALKDGAARISLTAEQVVAASRFSPPIAVKLAFAKDGQTGSLSFGTETRKLGISYDGSLVSLEGGPTQTPFTFNAGLSIALDTGNVANRHTESLRLAAEAERLRKESATASLSLAVRQAFQAWKRSDDARSQTERAVTLATEILATVQARAANGFATSLELERAELTADRAVFGALVSAVEAEIFRRNAAVTARYPIE
ncbi:MAG: TolC family protein [Rectinemataceae bacterium]